jgi:uncharacterized protein
MTTGETRLRIDAHVHLVGAGEAHGNFVRDKVKSGLAARYLRTMAGVGVRVSDEVFDTAYVDHLATLVRDARHLDKAIVFSFDGLYDEQGRLDPRTDTIVSNEWAIEAVRRYPDLFIFGANIHPGRPDALDELDRCAEAGAVCVKWVPPAQGIDPSDKRYTRFYEKMRDHRMALTSHTGYEHSVFVPDQTLGDPERLRLPLEMGLTVVAGHSGTSGFIHKVEYFPNMLRMVEEFDRLYADTSAIANPLRFTYRQRLLEPPMRDRILQGTDYPVPPVPLLWAGAIGPLRAARIQATLNPFDRDYLGKIEAGFPVEHFYRGHDVFLSASR